MELEEFHCVKIHDDAKKKKHSTIEFLETYMYAFFDSMQLNIYLVNYY